MKEERVYANRDLVYSTQATHDLPKELDWVKETPKITGMYCKPIDNILRKYGPATAREICVALYRTEAMRLSQSQIMGSLHYMKKMGNITCDSKLLTRGIIRAVN